MKGLDLFEKIQTSKAQGDRILFGRVEQNRTLGGRRKVQHYRVYSENGAGQKDCASEYARHYPCSECNEKRCEQSEPARQESTRDQQYLCREF